MPTVDNTVFEWLSDEPGSPEVLIELTPSHATELGTFTTVRLPFPSMVGAGIPGVRAFKGLVLGIADTDTAKVVVNLSVLTGDSDFEDARDVLLHPTYEGGGTITTDDYFRSFATHNLWRFYGAYDEAASARPLLWEGVQRPQPSVKGERAADGSLLLTIDLVGVGLWLAGTILMADVCAYGQEAGSTPLGPYRYVYQELYWNTVNIYAYANGVGGSTGSYPEFSFQPLWVLYQVIAALLQHVYRKLARRGTRASVLVVSPSGAASSHSSVLDHWECFEHNHQTDASANTDAPIAPVDRHILTKITLHDATDQWTGGLFARGTAKPEDTLERWRTLLDMLSDTTQAAFLKGLWWNPAFGDVFVDTYQVLGLWPIDAGPEDPAIVPDDFPKNPPFEIGALRQMAAKGAITGASSGDVTDIGYTPPFGTDREETYPLPAGFHTSATLWEIGTEVYLGEFDVINASDTTQLTVLSPNPNVWALYYPTQAPVPIVPSGTANLLTAERMLRVHRYTRTTDGTAVIDLPGGFTVPAYPTPDPTTIPHTYQGALDNFGNPLRVCLLAAQRETSMPAVACYAVVQKFGQERQTTYESDIVPAGECGALQVGSRVNVTGLPDGSFLVDPTGYGGDDYLGDLPGAPLISSSEFDLLQPTSKGKFFGTSDLE